MLALTDAALARLCIGATRVDPRRRGRWLRQIAERVDPPAIGQDSAERTPAARRKRKERAQHKAGFHYYGMWISDRAVCGLILKCIQEQRLTPEQATYPHHVKRAILELLEEEGNAWAR